MRWVCWLKVGSFQPFGILIHTGMNAVECFWCRWLYYRLRCLCSASAVFFWQYHFHSCCSNNSTSLKCQHIHTTLWVANNTPVITAIIRNLRSFLKMYFRQLASYLYRKTWKIVSNSPVASFFILPSWGADEKKFTGYNIIMNFLS